MIAYRIESELPLAKLLLRLSLVRAERRDGGALPDGPLYVTARRGLGPLLAGYLHRAAAARRRRRPARSGRAVRRGDGQRVRGGGIVLAVPRRPAARAHARLADADPGRRRLRARHRQRRGRGRLPPPDPPRILPRQFSRRTAAPVLARGRHRGVAAAGAGGDRGHRAGARARGAYGDGRAARPPGSGAGAARGGRRPLDGADGGGADPVEPGVVAAAALLRAARVGAAPVQGRVARARRAGARERRPRGDSLRDAVRARRPRRADSGGDAPDPGGVARVAGRAPGRDRAATRSCFPIARARRFAFPPRSWFRSSCAWSGR